MKFICVFIISTRFQISFDTDLIYLLKKYDKIYHTNYTCDVLVLIIYIKNVTCRIRARRWQPGTGSGTAT